MSIKEDSRQQGPQTLSGDRARLLELLVQKRMSERKRLQPRRRRDASNRVSLSWAQQRLWFIDQLEGGGAAYNLPIAMRLRGTLERSALCSALDMLVERHEALRTVIRDAEGDAQQEIAPSARFLLKQFSVSDCDGPQREQHARRHQLEEAQDLFDLRTGPLIRGRLLVLAADEHILMITMHHIISDGWSVGVLLQELAELYNAQLQLREPKLAPLPIQYCDYVVWQRECLQGALIAKQLDYWKTRLDGAPPELELPADYPRPAVQGYRGQSVPVALDASLTAELNALARRHGMTLFMILYAGWAILLARLTGQEDILMGTPVANRRRAEFEGLIGFFVNTLVLRASVSAQSLLTPFLAQVREITLGAFDHQDVPFEQLVEVLRPERNLSRHPIFQVMFVLQNAPRSGLQLSGVSAQLLEPMLETSKFDLLLSLEERAAGIAGCVNFDSDLFERATVERWVASLEQLLRAMVQGSHECIGELPILTEPDRHMIEGFNATQTSRRSDVLVHELFEEQALRTPDAVAVVYDEQSLTYAELNSKANRLAHYLRRNAVGADSVVGICVERSIEMVVGLLAILKAGGAYLPLDPNYPLERLKHMLEDAAPPVILTQEAGRATLPATGSRVVALDFVQSLLAEEPEINLRAVDRAPSNLLYVIYTSGSTGKPKGTAMPHRAMINLLEWHRTALSAAPGTRVLQFAALSFDVAFQEIFSTLCAGATLVLVHEAIRKDARALTNMLNRQRVQRLFVPPLMLQSLAESCNSTGCAPSTLEDIIAAGEQLRITPEIRHLFKRLDRCRLHNHYGPTETHVVTALTLPDDPERWPALPTIGQPIANTQIHVLDPRGKRVPPGVCGEIYIAGANLARCYLHQPKLTAERFLRDPYSADASARMYKTGDVGRWRADGTVEYLGRNDDQVKLRGFRIEPGEIESQLGRHPAVKEAVAVAREDQPGEKRLVAYVTLRSGCTVSVEQLRTHLKAVLPAHMVPSAFVILEQLPLTASGKLSRRALPPPDVGAYVTEQFEAPQSPVEEALAQIWQELLSIERVGRNDNFFELGGHSLLVLKAVFKVNQVCHSALRVADMYRSATVRELAALITGARTDDPLVELSREAALDEQFTVHRGLLRQPARAMLLTGATGFVGRFLLAQLLQDTVARIYCLVRARSQHEADARLKATLLKWDLWRDEWQARVIAVRGELRLPRLGLDTDTYELLAADVDSVYHCGTSMNHLETYAMAKAANVQAARELLQLVTRHKPKVINYISTLGVFAPTATAVRRVVDETTPITGEQHISSRGYVASKWVGEQIFMNAAARGVACNIFRLGLVWADTQLGRYDELQRGYRILKSCLLSRYGISGYQYEMPPTPVDYVAHAVVFLGEQHSDGGGIFHISAPADRTHNVFERCNDILARPLELLPYYDWVCAIKDLHARGLSLPVVPLFEFAFAMSEGDFYRYLREMSLNSPQFDCSRTHRELEREGIRAPVLDGELLRRSVDSMLDRDPDLQQLSAAGPVQAWAARSEPRKSNGSRDIGSGLSA